MPTITDTRVGYEFKDRNLEFLNQLMTPCLSLSTKVQLSKQKLRKVLPF